MRQAHNPLAAHVRMALGLCILGLISASSGCVALEAVKDYCRYNDNSNDFVMGWRNSVWARQAWHAQKYQYAGHPQFHAFGEGFRDGYVAVASGGNGCPPPVPPRRYWNWRYQTPEGQAQVAAWWEGFPYGARAADEDGAGLYQQIQVSHSIEVQYSPEFLNPAIPPQLLPGPNALPGPVPAPESVFPLPPNAQRPLPELPVPQSGAATSPNRESLSFPPPGGPPPSRPLPVVGRPAIEVRPVSQSSPAVQSPQAAPTPPQPQAPPPVVPPKAGSGSTQLTANPAQPPTNPPPIVRRPSISGVQPAVGLQAPPALDRR